MAITQGDCFLTFTALDEAINEYMKVNFVQLYKRNTRTINGFKKHFPSKSALSISPDLKYGEIDYHCIHGGKKFVSKIQGARPNQR